MSSDNTACFKVAQLFGKHFVINTFDELLQLAISLLAIKQFVNNSGFPSSGEQGDGQFDRTLIRLSVEFVEWTRGFDQEHFPSGKYQTRKCVLTYIKYMVLNWKCKPHKTPTKGAQTNEGIIYKCSYLHIMPN